jgi:hypothetical protein
VAAGSFESADADPALDSASASTPAPLTPDECATAERALLSSRSTAHDERLQDQIADALAWVAGGCQPDGLRGFIPFPDGHGGELRLLIDPSLPAGVDGVAIPLVPIK